jgi:acetyl esterase
VSGGHATPDPALRPFLDAAARLPLTPTDAPDLSEQRRAVQAGMGPLVAPLVGAAGPTARLAGVEDHEVDGPGGAFRVRVYTPLEAAPRPALVSCHGGAWWLGSIEMADAVCRDRAARAGCVVVSVDYHLAPEHRYPVALDDCDATLRWVVSHAEQLGIDTTRVAVGGG